MATGDWATGTTAKVTNVNVSFDAGFTQATIACQYQIVLASGEIASDRGFNQQVVTVQPWFANVQALVLATLQAAANKQGVAPAPSSVAALTAVPSPGN